VSGVPEGVPSLLSSGDVAALLGITINQVRHARRRGLESIHEFGAYSHHAYTPEAVHEYATRAGIKPDWYAVMTSSTTSTTTP